MREKILTTLFWAALAVAAAMAADYLITVVLLRDYEIYTPLVTFAIATTVATPLAYALVSSRLDLRKARDELAAARDTAVKANEAKTVFFSNMSHELRTPLNAILGFSEMLSLESFAARRVEYAKLIHSSGEHLLGLVNDLLDLSRIEAGRLDIRAETVDLGAVIADCIATTEPRAVAAELGVTRRIDSDLPLVTADERAVKQILLNLLTNAIKFSPVHTTVELFARLERSGELAFGVRDEGRGIPEADQARLFERFGQTRHEIAQVEKGAGLGLPIVKGLAEALGGRVVLESQPAKGTCVTVWLPLERVHAKIAKAS